MNVKMFQSELEALLKKERRQEAYKAIIEACNDAEHSEMAVESITEVTFRLLNKEREKQVEQLVIKYLINNNEPSSEHVTEHEIGSIEYFKAMERYWRCGGNAARSKHELGSVEHCKAIAYSVDGVGYVNIMPSLSPGSAIRIIVAGEKLLPASPKLIAAVTKEIEKYKPIHDSVIVEGLI